MFDGGAGVQDGGDADIGAVLAALAGSVPPGPAAVGVLAQLDPRQVDAGAQVDLLIALERQIGWLQARQGDVLVAMADRRADGPVGGAEFLRCEISAALHVADPVAESRLHVARQLHSRLPGTRGLLADGRISYWHALRIVEATAALSDGQAAAVEARVLPKAGGQTVGQLGRALSRAVIAAGPAAAQAAHTRAAAERTVNFHPLPDGIAGLWMVGPAADVSTVYTALTALADRPRPAAVDRRAGARRFDAMTELGTAVLTGGWDGTPLPARHGQRPQISVTVAGSTLLGADDQPAELAGYGPITAENARRIAAEGTWRRILFDPADGQLLDYGRTTYEPPADLKRHIIARDRTCTFPHCTRPARRCDIDHAVPWDQGGCTCPENCHAACRRHHRAKTVGGWHVTRHPHHATTWTSPTGHTHTTRPPPYGGDPADAAGDGDNPPPQRPD